MIWNSGFSNARLLIDVPSATPTLARILLAHLGAAATSLHATPLAAAILAAIEEEPATITQTWTLLVLPFITSTTAYGTGILLAAFFLQGVGITGCNVHVDSIRQALIPNQLQGRVNASYRLLASGVLSLGALAGGWLGERIGLQQTLLVGAVGLLSTWLWLVFSPVRTLRAFPPQELASMPASEQGAMDDGPTRMEARNPIHQEI